MRTTLDIDADIMDVARNLARQQGVSLGTAVSRLARRGLSSGRHAESDDGFPTFQISEDAPPFGTKDVRDALEDE